MSYLQLVKNSYELNVVTHQVPQEVVFLTKERLFIIFQNHCQLWDLSSLTLQYQTRADPYVFFWVAPTPIDDTTIALINVRDCKPELGTFNIQTSTYTTLYHFEQNNYQNFEMIFYDKSLDEIIVVTCGKTINIYWYNRNQMLIKSIPNYNMVSKYGELSTLAFSGIEYSEQQKSNFTLVTPENSKTYCLENFNIDIQEISSICKHSSQTAIIGICHTQKHFSTVIIYNHNLNTILFTYKIGFLLDGLFLTQEGWLAMRSTQENSSFVQMQSCFDKVGQDYKQFGQVMKIPQRFRIWDSYSLISTIGYKKEVQNGKVKVDSVRLVNKRSLYIKMMEELKIDIQFGDQIVKAVTNALT